MQLKWILEPPPELEVRVGNSLRVPCEASGQPTPRIEWTKLDSNDSSTTLGSKLDLISVSQEDSGLYECKAKNGVEKDLKSRMKLSVLGKYCNRKECISHR